MKTRGRFLAVFLTTLVAVGLLPSAASAGTYTVYSCQGPTGAPASTASWAFELSHPDDNHDDSCPRGGLHVALAVNTPHAPNTEARMMFLAPADTQIVSYRLWRSARIAKGDPYFFSGMERFGSDWRWAGDGCKGTDGCAGVGDPSTPLATANRWSRVPPTPATGIALYVSCGLPNSGTTRCPVTSGSPAEAWLHRGEVTLADDVSPAFETPPTGSLVDAVGPVSGRAAVSLQASDKGGGLTQAEVEIDGTVVARQPLGEKAACDPPFTGRVPCPLRASATVPVDTTALPDGTHSVRVLLRDAGGNVTASGPTSVTTVNDQSCNPDPAAAGAAGLRAGLVRPGAKRTARTRGSSRVTVRYGARKRAVVTGQLSAPGGGPIAGAPVCIVWRPQGLTVPLATLAKRTTDGSGRFSVPVPRGPSRDLWAIHRVASGAVARKLTLRVVPRLTVRPSRRSLRNGQVVTLRGTVAGGPIPKRGVIVRAEAWRGTHWQAFGEARARGKHGRYTVRYRFTGTTGVQRYSLRTRVVAQAGYPYVGVASKRVRVRVRG